MILHGYWRSGAAYRVRLALALKGIAYEQVTHDLRAGEQRADAYRALAPQGLVPALEVDGAVLVQSGAILEWLEETHPAPPLLPTDLRDRAVVRAMAATIGCDIHPLGNLRVLKAVRDLADETAVTAWVTHWIADGFAALETMTARHGQRFLFGDTPTIADCYLVPQLYSARRFAVDLAPYPGLVAAGAALEVWPGIAAAHPDAQPDADPA